MDQIKDKINTFTSEKLCAIIACFRYLKYNQELTLLAMQELAIRRQNGDQFDFESTIENYYSKLPVINTTPTDIRSVLNKFVGNKK